MSLREAIGQAGRRFCVVSLVVLSLSIAGCPTSGMGVGGNGNTGNMNDNDNSNNNTNANDNGNTNDNGNVNDNANANDNMNDNGSEPPVSLFTRAQDCAACHAGLTDDLGNDVSIEPMWRGSLMSNTAIDPFFQASVASEVERAPEELESVVEYTCAKCHTPMANGQALFEGSEVELLEDGFFDPGHPLYDLARDGVSCTVCHQIQDDFLEDPEASFDGNFVIDTATGPPERPLFGPYADPQQPDVMALSVGFTPTFGPHIEASGLCATCHTLFTPTLDANGEIIGTFPEQTPFLEWQQSVFSDGGADDRTCQSCHMPVAEAPAVASRVPAALDSREPFYRHVFVGGNVFIQRILRDNAAELGVSATGAQLDDAIARNLAFLQDEAVDLSVIEPIVNGGMLEFDVLIANKAGHKFPTSFPSRRAWLHVMVSDATGQMVFESGAVAADGTIEGSDSDVDRFVVEPHYDEITSADQVQVYEAIMENSDGEVTYTLLRGADYRKDNRLLPEGFDKAMATEDTAVHGAAVGDDDFVGGGDEVTYIVPVSADAGPFTIDVELLYQSITPGFATDVRADEHPLIDTFGAMYDAADKTPTVIATATISTE